MNRGFDGHMLYKDDIPMILFRLGGKERGDAMSLNHGLKCVMDSQNVRTEVGK
jgi:hypothetical protein